MRIGYFVETPVEKNLTGGSRSFLDLITQLIPMGVEPFVVVSEKWALTEQLDTMGVPYITVRMYRPFVGIKEKAKFYRGKYRIKQIINARAWARAKKFFQRNGVQLIHINSQFCGLVGAKVARSMGIPYVYHIREYLSSDFGVEFYNKEEADRLISGANAIIAISTSIQNYMKQKFPNSNIVRIYNGINVDKVSCPDKLRFQGEKTKIVIVGRVTDAKNQKDIIQAVDILVNEYHCPIQLFIVGYMGTDIYELSQKQYVEKHGLSGSIEFVSFTNNPMEITHNCDIGVICSLKEAFGRVTIEYMMSNLFVIGSDAGATPELINNGNDGLLYILNDSRDLAKKILWAIEHKKEANEMLMRGKRKAIEQYSIQATANSIYNLYCEFAKER